MQEFDTDTLSRDSQKTKMHKKIFSLFEYYSWDGSFVYDCLKIILYNTLVDIYNQNSIDSFLLQNRGDKFFIKTYSKSYNLDFMSEFEFFMYKNGPNNWEEELLSFKFSFENQSVSKNALRIKEIIEKILYREKMDIYDFIEFEME